MDVKMMFFATFVQAMWRRGSIEAIGTFVMVFVGCGSVALERSPLEISLAFGAIVASSSSQFVVGVELTLTLQFRLHSTIEEISHHKTQSPTYLANFLERFWQVLLLVERVRQYATHPGSV